MKRPRILPAFSTDEKKKVHELLATRVAFMMGRKFEEDDWAYVYCAAKGIPNQGWSNLKLDVVHDGLGVEHKMLRPSGDKPVSEVFGSRLMHPSATRSIRISSNGEANEVMKDVIEQYAAYLKQRREKVHEQQPNKEPNMRTGWLLWQSNLRDFVYFEEETLIPDPNDYIAEWHENISRGARKASKSLWIYEKETRAKKYSVTTDAGAKIQPYFDVPPASEPNLYFFRVQGEEYGTDLVRIWIPTTMARELKRLTGELTADNLQSAISNILSGIKEPQAEYNAKKEEAAPVILKSETYLKLDSLFPNAVSDSHKIQLLVELLNTR
ncbi:MAG: hypothetical protein FD146_2330 [Anaerolineaceae bacterium]|nr:MAG: hypothetical protein FD146_2330 [Anaerolineaceae bacterium]